MSTEERRTMRHEFYVPTQMYFGAGCLEELGSVELPGKKAMIVTTPDAWIKEGGYVDRIQALLKKNGADSILYDRVHPNPGKRQVVEAAEICRRENCDMLIGFGGGSSIDSAKSIALVSTNDGDLWDYVVTGSGRGHKIKNKPLPIIAIPTTAGTGSEVNPWVVITKEETNEKLGFGAKELFATMAFVDAELMLSVPRMLTAFQGFDALFHAMEGYIANVATPISDIFALKSISLLGENLIKVVEDGHDLEAREKVAMASSYSGIVETISNCTSNHSIGQAMGAYHDNLPHGAALLMIADEYFASFVNVIPERYRDMARALTGNPNADEYALLARLKEMEEACGVSGLKMSDYGIQESELEVFCQNAMEFAGELFEIEPEPLSKERVMEILRKSYR